MTRILLVEDEENYREPLALNLRRDGFEVVEAADGTQAVERFEAAGGPGGQAPLDLVLLDLMLPSLSGTEVCRRIRRTSRIPVIMLTARDDEIDKIVGLEIGADDYVTKPYSYRELVARVHAVLRRSQEGEPDAPLLGAGRVAMDVERHEVRVDGEVVAMPLRAVPAQSRSRAHAQPDHHPDLGGELRGGHQDSRRPRQTHPGQDRGRAERAPDAGHGARARLQDGRRRLTAHRGGRSGM